VIRGVEQGESYTVTRRGVPVARLAPIAADTELRVIRPARYREAGLLPGANLRTPDALHLAVAVRIGVDAVVTDDARMAQAARDVGLAVRAPA